LNLVGLVTSPGRGLLLYSPLIVLGLLGLRELWRQDRSLAWAIVVPAVVNLAIIAATYVWTDDTWGPRYVVPTAWLLVLPIAWWTRGRRRIRAVAAVAVIGIYVQIVGVFSPFYASSLATRQLSGVLIWPIGLRANVPYGGDPARWIPQLSPIVLQSEVLFAWIDRQLTGSGFTVTYDPTWGAAGRLDLSDPGRAVHSFLPDFWWRATGGSAGLDTLAALLGLLALVGATGLTLQLARPGGGALPVSAQPVG
jgi:hypothetical protein